MLANFSTADIYWIRFAYEDFRYTDITGRLLGECAFGVSAKKNEPFW